MLTGVSSATRVSHQRAMSSAWRLVSEAANLQPVLPVQATRPARIAVASVASPSASIAASASCDLVVRHAGDQQVLPDRQPDIAVAEIARDRRRARASARPSACRPAARRRSSSARPASAHGCRYARCGRTPAAARPRPAGRASNLRPSFSSTSRQKFLDAHGVEHVFQPRLVAVGAVAVLDEHAHHRIRDLARVRGPTSTPVSRAKSLCPVMPPRQSRNQTPGSSAKTVVHLHRLEADVVGVFQHRDACRRRRRRR